MKLMDYNITAVEYGEGFDTVCLELVYVGGYNYDIHKHNVVLNFAKNGDLIAYHKED